MEIRFKHGDVVEMDNVKIVFRNFSGSPSAYNKEGDRNFSIVIDEQEIADELIEHGWNVRIKQPREEGDRPFMHLPVKVKFNSRGPSIYLESLGKRVRLDEESIERLDNIDIRRVDLDIRPYHSTVQGQEYQTAYLQSILVVQETDRFAEGFVEHDSESYDSDEMPFK